MFAVLAVLIMAMVAFVPAFEQVESASSRDYWTYTVTSDGKVTGSGSATASPTAAGASGTTGKYTSNDGTHVGSWGFDSKGYGPFGSFYAAFDACHGNKIVCHLDPNDLKSSIGKPEITIGDDCTYTDSEGKEHMVNIMWVLPTIYWSVDGSGNLVLSNDPSKGTAYAHTIDGDVHEYLGIGVYEASTASVGDKTVLTSTTGASPLYNQNRATFREYANNNTVATEDGTTVTGHAMLWNLYAWQLYRFCVLTVGGGWNSQGIFGNGDVSGANTGTSVNATGDLDQSGPYAGTIGNYDRDGSDGYHGDSVKAFIEDAWGSLHDFVDGVLIYHNNIQNQMYATQSSKPTNSLSDYSTTIGILPLSAGYYSPSTSSGYPAYWGLPTGTSGSATSGLYDSIATGSGSSSTNLYGLFVGGCSSNDTSLAPKYGLSYMYTNQVTYSSQNVGGRLAFVFDGDPAETMSVKYMDDGTLQKEDILQKGLEYTISDEMSSRQGFTFVGWSDGSRVYRPGVEITVGSSDITLTAVWRSVFIPTPDDEEEPVEVVTYEDSEPWLGKNGKTVLLMAILVAIIAELAVLSISRKR